jgi:hypothetical protein
MSMCLQASVTALGAPEWVNYNMNYIIDWNPLTFNTYRYKAGSHFNLFLRRSAVSMAYMCLGAWGLGRLRLVIGTLCLWRAGVRDFMAEFARVASPHLGHRV